MVTIAVLGEGQDEARVATTPESVKRLKGLGAAVRVAAGAAERVPPADGEPQVVLHGLAFDQLVGVVVLEGEGTLGVGTFIVNGADLRKKLLSHRRA